MIELDVRRTGDGQLAVLHDAILHDHSGARVALDGCTLDDFQRRTGLEPPRLEEVLEWADGRIGLDVELKEDGYAEQVAPLLRRFAQAGNELIVSSFLDPLLARLAEIAPELELGLLLRWSAGRGVERALATGARMLLPEMRLVTDALIRTVTDAGLELIVWDFMAADHAWLLSDRSVSAVITDDVPGALAARG